MQPTSSLIVGLGEVLWDLLPTGRLLGGAPFNFAFHCHQLGHPTVMVSRVGADEMGRSVREAIRGLGLSDEFVQTDADRPTGTVSVAMNNGGHTFTITPNVAWDHLTWDHRLEQLIHQARAVCFGTLAQREPTTRATVRKALATAPPGALIVFDVNLRQHYYNREEIEASLAASRWVKLNEEELTVLRDLLNLSGETDAAALTELRRRYDLELAALTRGERGCLVQTADEEVEAAGVPTKVVDTIGAGDAFTAGLLAYRLEGSSLADAAAFANRLAAQVAASAGGTPRIERREVEQELHCCGMVSRPCHWADRRSPWIR